MPVSETVEDDERIGAKDVKLEDDEPDSQPSGKIENERPELLPFGWDAEAEAALIKALALGFGMSEEKVREYWDRPGRTNVLSEDVFEWIKNKQIENNLEDE